MKNVLMIVATLCAVIVLGTAADTFAAAIGNTVWNDRNANGKHDPGEEGIAGVKVKLYYGNKKETDRTNSLGRYKFKDLDAGHYTVTVAQETLPEGCYPTYDRDGNNNGTYSDKYLKEDDYFTHADFGYHCPTQAAVKRVSPATGAGSVAFILALIVAIGVGVLTYHRTLIKDLINK